MALPTWMLRPHASGRYGGLRVGLVGFWPLDEDAASGDVTAIDNSGLGNDLTSNNTVASVEGKWGNARSFVAANSEYLSRGSSADMQFGNGDWSLSLWVAPKSSTTALGVVVSKDQFGAREFSLNAQVTTTNNTNNFRLQVFNTSNNSSVNIFEAADISSATFTSQWWHVVVVNSGGVVTLYRNGVSRATGTRPAGQTFNAAGTAFNIGRSSLTSNESYFTGWVDEVAKWSRALSVDEVAVLYANGLGIDMRR